MLQNMVQNVHESLTVKGVFFDSMYVFSDQILSYNFYRIDHRTITQSKQIGLSKVSFLTLKVFLNLKMRV